MQKSFGQRARQNERWHVPVILYQSTMMILVRSTVVHDSGKQQLSPNDVSYSI